jgi:hypothetical protein
MEKFYSSSKAQIILFLIFGNLIGLILLVKSVDVWDGFWYLVASLITFFATWFIFIGWKRQNKQITQEMKISFLDKVAHFNRKIRNLLTTLFTFGKRKKMIVVTLVVMLMILVAVGFVISSKEDSNYRYISEQNDIKKPSCTANLADLVLVESHSETYNLYNYNSEIGSNPNNVRFFGLIKNNSICKAYNVVLKITLQSINNPDIKQEELKTLFSPWEPLDTQQTKEFSETITVFESLISKESSYGSTEHSRLRSGVKVSIQIVSAQAAPSDQF